MTINACVVRLTSDCLRVTDIIFILNRYLSIHFRGSSCFLFPPAMGLGSLLTTSSSAPDRPFYI